MTQNYGLLFHSEKHILGLGLMDVFLQACYRSWSAFSHRIPVLKSNHEVGIFRSFQWQNLDRVSIIIVNQLFQYVQ